MPIGELIDTLWNVNEYDFTFAKVYYNELIDTLWNVNFLLTHVVSLLHAN